MALTRNDIENIIGDKIEDKEILSKIVNDIVTKHSDTLRTVVEENKQFKSDMERRNKDIEDLKKTLEQHKKAAGENEKTQKALVDLQEKYSRLEIDKAVDLTIASARGKYPDKIKKLLDMDIIANGKDRNSEIQKQIESLAKETPELFIIEEQIKNVNTGGNASGGAGVKTFTIDEVKKMTPEEINKNWNGVQAALKQQK